MALRLMGKMPMLRRIEFSRIVTVADVDLDVLAVGVLAVAGGEAVQPPLRPEDPDRDDRTAGPVSPTVTKGRDWVRVEGNGAAGSNRP